MFGKELDPRSSRVNAKLKSVEIETALSHDNDLDIEDTPRRQRDSKGLQQFREVAVERLAIAALNDDVIVVAKDQCPEAVPFRFKYPVLSLRKLRYSFGEHRQYRRGYGKSHASILRCRNSIWFKQDVGGEVREDLWRAGSRPAYWPPRFLSGYPEPYTTCVSPGNITSPGLSLVNYGQATSNSS